jgi:hypothetical protein
VHASGVLVDRRKKNGWEPGGIATWSAGPLLYIRQHSHALTPRRVRYLFLIIPIAEIGSCAWPRSYSFGRSILAPPEIDLLAVRTKLSPFPAVSGPFSIFFNRSPRTPTPPLDLPHPAKMTFVCQSHAFSDIRMYVCLRAHLIHLTHFLSHVIICLTPSADSCLLGLSLVDS